MNVGGMWGGLRATGRQVRRMKQNEENEENECSERKGLRTSGGQVEDQQQTQSQAVTTDRFVRVI